MRGFARVAAAGVFALMGAGCAGDGTGGAGGMGDAEIGGQLEVSGTVSARLERRLSESGALSERGRPFIRHMDVRSDGFTALVGGFGLVVVGGLDLEAVQVLRLPEDERRGNMLVAAARVHAGRLLVMEPAWGARFWAYPMGSGDGGGLGGGELVVDLGTGDDMRATGGFGMGTDFAVRADGSIVAPVHEGPTYLGVAWPPRDSVATGPAWDTRADAGEFGQLFRYWNRVAGLEDGGLLVWDDYSAVVIEAAADGTESRWSLPEEYRRTGLQVQRLWYGNSVEVDLGRPTMEGWSVVDGSVCMAVRPVDDFSDDVGLLRLDLDGAGELPVLRRIDLDAPADIWGIVSCGIVGDVLLVATVGDVLRYRLGAETESPE